MYTCVCACMCVCVCVSVCVLRIVSVDKILHFIKYFIIYMYSWPWTLQRHHWATPFFVLKALHLFCLCYVCRKREVTVTSVMRKEVFIVKWALCVCVCVCVCMCVCVCDFIFTIAWSCAVDVQVCRVLQQLCDLQLRHRVESIISFSESFVASVQNVSKQTLSFEKRCNQTIMFLAVWPSFKHVGRNKASNWPPYWVVSTLDCGSESLGFESHQSLDFSALAGSYPELGVLWAQWEGWNHTSELHPLHGCVWGCYSNDQHCRCCSSWAWLTPG